MLTPFIWALQLTFPIFSYNMCLPSRARKVRVTFSQESLIRLTHGSSFRNSLGVWDVWAGHYRLRAFSQVVKDLHGITASLVPVPKTSLPLTPEVSTVFLCSTRTLCWIFFLCFLCKASWGLALHFGLLPRYNLKIVILRTVFYIFLTTTKSIQITNDLLPIFFPNKSLPFLLTIFTFKGEF